MRLTRSRLLRQQFLAHDQAGLGKRIRTGGEIRQLRKIVFFRFETERRCQDGRIDGAGDHGGEPRLRPRNGQDRDRLRVDAPAFQRVEKKEGVHLARPDESDCLANQVLRFFHRLRLTDDAHRRPIGRSRDDDEIAAGQDWPAPAQRRRSATVAGHWPTTPPCCARRRRCAPARRSCRAWRKILIHARSRSALDSPTRRHNPR